MPRPSSSARSSAVDAQPAPPVPDVPVEVRRSARRTRTVSAYRQDGRVVVLIPARMSRADERRWVERMVRRVAAPARSVSGDEELERRAAGLARRFLDGRARPTSVRWSDRQQRRWGSCTSATGAIRLSRALADMPTYVLDYVLVHELAHLLVPDHSAAFWELVGRYPRADRARGFLDGVAHGAGRPVDPPAHDDGVDDVNEVD